MKIIFVVGPTGVGKTKLSIELAKKLDGEVVNADSVQVYEELVIGSAKTTQKEMDGIPHHLFDLKKLDENYTIYDYQKDARKKIDEILKRGKTVIVVGGSGLYINACYYDYEFKKEDNIIDIESLSDEEMYKELLKKNLPFEIDKDNRRRLMRYYVKYVNNSEEFTFGDVPSVYDNAIFLGLMADRKELYSLLDKRVDLMIEKGLIEEVRNLYRKYPNSRQLHSSICYKELIKYINGECMLEDAIIEMKKNNRNYAKRQYTWLNHKLPVTFIDVDFLNFDRVIENALEIIKNKP